jgi:hypothetical protein
VQLELAANEDPVLLTIDANDEVDWVLPGGASVTEGATRRARGRATASRPRSGPRTVTFDVPTTTTVRKAGARGRRAGVLSRVATGVAGFAFKFVRAKVTKKLIEHLEKDVSPALVRVTADAPHTWASLGSGERLPAVSPRGPGDAPRVLLLVHGTFSSTVGSYGGLFLTTEGQSFLREVHGHYDHIIGWDHRTLSEEPEPNARAILAALDAQRWPVAPVIDAIGYSRGGLVLRTLLERVIPGTPWEGRFQQALFVGSTLNGTKLAQEKNWKAFVKIYTNIAIAACRGVAIVVPPAAVASVWVGTVARGVSVLVRFLATATLDKGGVPGLASMDPDQAIVKAMNRTAPPATLSATYRAITNDYEPGAADSDGIPPSFRNKLADLIMDAQMNEPNDLVVNQSSMSFVCGALPAAQVMVLPTNGRTIHTTYFQDPAVIAQLRTWLLGSGASPAAGAPRSARSTTSSRPQAGRRKTLRRRG